MTRDEKELVFRIGQCCWWMMIPEEEAEVIDPDGKVRAFLRNRLAYVIHGLRLKEEYESYKRPEDAGGP